MHRVSQKGIQIIKHIFQERTVYDNDKYVEWQISRMLQKNFSFVKEMEQISLKRKKSHPAQRIASENIKASE